MWYFQIVVEMLVFIPAVLSFTNNNVHFRNILNLVQHSKKSQERIHRTAILSIRDDNIANVDSDYKPLKQLSIQFDCNSIDSDEISEILFELGVLSVSVEVVTEKTSFLNDEERWGDLVKTKSWDAALIRANIPSTFNTDILTDILLSTYPNQITEENINIIPIEDVDWVSKVQATWPPQVIGDLVVRFPWHDKGDSRHESIKHQLVLEGGAAFGTGDHPTTRLCCSWLQRTIAALNNNDVSVLDYGCGSAILGLTALKFGASEAAGVDIDRDALLSALNNCRMNSLQMDMYLSAEDGSQVAGMASSSGSIRSISELQDRKFDLIVANILAPALIFLAPNLSKFTKPGGRIALAGIVKRQADTVMKAYSSNHFEQLQVEALEDDWVLVTGVRR